MGRPCTRCGEKKEAHQLSIKSGQDICVDCLDDLNVDNMKPENLEATLPENYYADEREAPPTPAGIIPTRQK